MKQDRRAYWSSVVFLLPALLIFGLFFYLPFLQSIYYSFTEWNALKAPRFIGFDNYVNLFSDPRMKDGLKNTLMMVVFGIIVQNSLAMLIAVLLNRPLRTKAFLRTGFYLPVIVSLVVTSIIWGQLLNFDGLLNGVLIKLGLESVIQDWMGNVQTSFPAIMLLTQWQGIGYCAIIYLAGLQSIPNDIYEAAEIEGAKGFALFRKITVPMLMTTITVVLFLIIVGALRLFELPYILTNGGPGTSSYTLFLAVYNAAFQNNTYGYATAGGIVLAFFIIIIALIQLGITRRWEVEL